MDSRYSCIDCLIADFFIVILRIHIMLTLSNVYNADYFILLESNWKKNA